MRGVRPLDCSTKRCIYIKLLGKGGNIYDNYVIGEKDKKVSRLGDHWRCWGCVHMLGLCSSTCNCTRPQPGAITTLLSASYSLPYSFASMRVLCVFFSLFYLMLGKICQCLQFFVSFMIPFLRLLLVFLRFPLLVSQGTSIFASGTSSFCSPSSLTLFSYSLLTLVLLR